MTFAALPEERLLEQPKAPKLAARGRFAFVLLICFLLHAIPISLFLHGNRSDGLAPDEQEIPVEMVVEPPPPKEPEPPKPEPQQKQATLDEKMATDAPRESNDDKTVKDSQDKVTHAPKTAPDVQPAKPNTANAAEAKAIDQRAEGDPVQAAELQKPDTTDQTGAEHAAPQPETQQTAAQDPLSAFAPMPDYSFAPASRRAPVAGGKAASTYLSIVYGMVLARVRAPDAAAHHAETMGRIAFDVDLAGYLVKERLVKSSGSPEMDAAAMAAIRAASPYPPPPTGTGLSLTLSYGK